MKRTFKLCILGLGFLMIFSVPELRPLDPMGQRIEIQPGKLEIVDVPESTGPDVDEMLYIQASNAQIIVFAIVPGYTDKQDVEHVPAYRVSMKNAVRLTLYVYFKVTKNARVAIMPFISGPVAGMATMGEEPYSVDAKKNVIYRQEFVTELSMLPPGYLFPGIYDMLGIVMPSEQDAPFSKSGGMTHVTCRVILAK